MFLGLFSLPFLDCLCVLLNLISSFDRLHFSSKTLCVVPEFTPEFLL